jgi:FkbM family methyltransferase
MPSGVKPIVTRMLCNDVVGSTIAALCGNRIPAGDVTIFTGGSGVTPVVKAALFWQLYEAAEIRFVQKYLPRDLDVVELGSSLGVVSSHIARRINPDRQLVCIEANPEMIDFVRRNVRMNGGGDRVAIIEAAIDYDGDGDFVMLELREDNTTSRLSTGGSGVSGHVRVPATTLSRVLRQQDIGDYALVCDIEGAEVPMILNDAAALERCRLMIIELHTTTVAGVTMVPAEISDLLTSLGYTRVATDGPVEVHSR